MNHYDVIVVGSGPGGYNTAIRASQLGFTVACVERASRVGGAGIWTGCVPSRLLLHASKVYDLANRGIHAAVGVGGIPTLNLAQMMANKTTAQKTMSCGAHKLLRGHGVTLLHGDACFAATGQLVVRPPGGMATQLSGNTIVIATGSEPTPLPFAAFDHRQILDSTDALSLDRVPRHLAIIGAGAVGVELGTLWHRLGARVTLIERQSRVCHWLDADVTAALERSLRRSGIDVKVSCDVQGLERHPRAVSIRLCTTASGETTAVNADTVLVAIGRRPATAGLNLSSVGVTTGADGALPRRATATGGVRIYAVGDATAGAMLMPKAEEEAIACAEQIAGLPGFVNAVAIPYTLDTTPEVATIGSTEHALRDAGVRYRIGYCPMAADPRTAVGSLNEGFVKLLVDARTDVIAGAHLIGAGAAEMVAQVAVAMEASMLCEDFARVCHAFPASSEPLRQAAMAAGGWMMHA